jgi:hypothetical protein
VTPAQERVDAAVRRAAMGVIGLTLAEQLEAIMTAGFAAILAEVGPREDEAASRDAPSARELPTEPGAVVLVTELRGATFDPPIVAVRDEDTDDVAPWHTGVRIDGARIHDTDQITDFIPARVVRDDEQGPAAALRRILAAIAEPISCVSQLQAVEFAAREALKALGGEG